MIDQPSTPTSAGQQVVNALKLVADVSILPGTGLLVEGKVGEGMVYAAAGLATKVVLGVPFFGPIGLLTWLAVGLDSFSKSASGRHLWQLGGEEKPTSSAPSSVP